MNNRKHGNPSLDLVLALPVGAGASKGIPIALGSAGLYGIPMTDRATTATIAAGTAAQGLKDGEASVILPQIQLVIEVTNGSGGAAAQFAKLYVTSAGVITTTATSNTFVGWNLSPSTADGAKLKLGCAKSL